MTTHDDLIRENEELRARLALAERWMRREVEHAIVSVQKEGIKKGTRKHFENIFESEGVEMMTQRIMGMFGDVLESAPAHTLERLIDAEIYWATLQRYPHMDGLPVILAYQKILDAWIEDRLIAPWRISRKNMGFSMMTDTPLERDMHNILTKNYTISLGRFFQILQIIRGGEKRTPLVGDFLIFLQSEYPGILERYTKDDFFVPFATLMEREIFSKKRHEKKVSFTDVQETRDILVSKNSNSILRILLEF